MAAQFELKKSKNGKHFFNLLATNGEIVLTSQMYASIAGARKGIASVRSNAGADDRYKRRQGKKGKSHTHRSQCPAGYPALYRVQEQKDGQ